MQGRIEGRDGMGSLRGRRPRGTCQEAQDQRTQKSPVRTVMPAEKARYWATCGILLRTLRDVSDSVTGLKYKLLCNHVSMYVLCQLQLATFACSRAYNMITNTTILEHNDST